jgi:hypothetical protein
MEVAFPTNRLRPSDSTLKSRHQSEVPKTRRAVDPDGHVTYSVSTPRECIVQKYSSSPARNRTNGDTEVARDASRSTRNLALDKHYKTDVGKERAQWEDKINRGVEKEKEGKDKTTKAPHVAGYTGYTGVPKVIQVGRPGEPPLHPQIDPDVDVSKIGLKQDTLQQSLIIQDLATSRMKLEQENRFLRDQLDSAKEIIRQLKADKYDMAANSGRRRGTGGQPQNPLGTAAKSAPSFRVKQPHSRASFWLRKVGSKTNWDAFRNPVGAPGRKTFVVPACHEAKSAAPGMGQERNQPHSLANGLAGGPRRQGDDHNVKPKQIPGALTTGVDEGTKVETKPHGNAQQKPRSSTVTSTAHRKSDCQRQGMNPSAVERGDDNSGQQQQRRSKEENLTENKKCLELVFCSTHSTACSSSAEPQQAIATSTTTGIVRDEIGVH